MRGSIAGTVRQRRLAHPPDRVRIGEQRANGGDYGGGIGADETSIAAVKAFAPFGDVAQH